LFPLLASHKKIENYGCENANRERDENDQPGEDREIVFAEIPVFINLFQPFRGGNAAESSPWQASRAYGPFMSPKFENTSAI